MLGLEVHWENYIEKQKKTTRAAPQIQVRQENKYERKAAQTVIHHVRLLLFFIVVNDILNHRLHIFLNTGSCQCYPSDSQ